MGEAITLSFILSVPATWTWSLNRINKSAICGRIQDYCKFDLYSSIVICVQYCFILGLIWFCFVCNILC